MKNALSRRPSPTAVRPRAGRLHFARAVALASLFVLAPACSKRSDDARDSVLRIETRSGTGTGFFVAGPDGRRYVATAFHVIEGGGPITVARRVKQGETDAYVEAYPEARLVAYDREADLALLEIPNLPAERMKPLQIADAQEDEPIASIGYGASSLVSEATLMRKTGIVSNLTFLPVLDRVTGTMTKASAVKALIVSSDLEPGFSGGPTLNADDKVVGINVVKDAAHLGQNGCVHASLLTKLLQGIKPHHAPTTDEVKQFIADIQTRYLEVSTADRSYVPQSDFLALGEQPALHSWSHALLGAGRVSARMTLVQVSGDVLSTFDAAPANAFIADCLSKNSARSRLLSGTGVKQSNHCAELGIRPLAWGLSAAELGWDGRTTGYEIKQVNETDPRARHYEVKVRTLGETPQFLTLHLLAEGGRLKLRLFDNDETPFALKRGIDTRPEQLYGSWQRSDAHSTTQNVETISLEYRDAQAEVVHTVIAKNQLNNQVCWVRQRFVGKFERGVIVATADAKRFEPVAQGCPTIYVPDTQATFKLGNGDKLVMARNDGRQYVETVELEREKPRRAM
jgi:Trypsin-like peptidase domain